MEHIYKSIEIEKCLYEIFPDGVVEIICKYLKLAVDLNGYTNVELKKHIVLSQETNAAVNEYVRKKYGKSRSNLSQLKKYQLVHVIQHFNVPIEILRFPRNILRETIDKYLEEVTWTKDTLTLTKRDIDKRLDEKSPPLSIPLTDTKYMIRYKPEIDKEIKLYIQVKTVTDKYVICLVNQENIMLNKGGYYSAPNSGCKSIKKELFVCIMLNIHLHIDSYTTEVGKLVSSSREPCKKEWTNVNMKNNIEYDKYVSYCNKRYKVESFLINLITRNVRDTSIVNFATQHFNTLQENFETSPDVVDRIILTISR